MERTLHLPAVSGGRPVVVRVLPSGATLPSRYEETFHDEEESLNVLLALLDKL